MLVYLSGPITAADGHSVQENVDAAIAVYLRLMRNGVNAFCPHLSALVPEAFGIGYERWIEYDFAMIDVCSHMLMLDRWESSPGAVRERVYAMMMGKIVVYRVEDLL